jgi:hypothetical protein
MIARSEFTAVVNGGAKAAMRVVAGATSVSYAKMWIATEDARTRTD